MMERLYRIFCGDEPADEVMAAISELDAEINELFIRRAAYTQLLKDKLKQLNDYANSLVAKLNQKDIYSMSEQELYEYCKKKGLSEEECRIAKFVILDRLKGKELYTAMSYSERQAKRLRTAILNKIKQSK